MGKAFLNRLRGLGMPEEEFEQSEKVRRTESTGDDESMHKMTTNSLFMLHEFWIILLILLILSGNILSDAEQYPSYPT